MLLVGRTLARVAAKVPRGKETLYYALVCKGEKGVGFSHVQTEEFLSSIHPPLTHLNCYGGWTQCTHNVDIIVDQVKVYFPVRSLNLLRPLVQQLVDQRSPFAIKFAEDRRVDNAILWVNSCTLSALIDQLRSQPDKCVLSPFVLDSCHQSTELICGELAFVPRLLPNLNMYVARELRSSYMDVVSQLVERFLEQTEVLASLRELLARATIGEDEAASALARAFFADAIPFLKFETPDSLKGDEWDHDVVLSCFQCILENKTPLNPSGPIQLRKSDYDYLGWRADDKRDKCRSDVKREKVAVATASVRDRAGAGAGCDPSTGVATALDADAGAVSKTKNRPPFLPWTPPPHIMSFDAAKAYCKAQGFSNHARQKKMIFLAEAARAGLVFLNERQCHEHGAFFDFMLHSNYRIHTTRDPAGLLRLLKLARDVGGIAPDGRWGQCDNLDHGLLKTGVYAFSMLSKDDKFVLWRSQDSGGLNLEHWLSEQLFGEWDYKRERGISRRHTEPSDALKRLYEELYGTDGRAPDTSIPRCVVCREPLLREGEKQAVVKYDRRLRKFIVTEGVFLSTTADAKGGHVLGHAVCCLDSTSPAFDILLDEITYHDFDLF